jgi:membrane protein implicated in regulation of membrane protease activity
MEMSLLFWIILGTILLLVDIFTSAFLFVWIALGAFSAAIADFVGLTFGMQAIIFCVVSVIACMIGYPWVKKKFKNIKRTELMEDKYVGMEFTAEEDIEEKVQLKVEGIYWTGYNLGEKIYKGEKFKIKEIKGNKLILKKV